jgi:hypothetical protein
MRFPLVQQSDVQIPYTEFARKIANFMLPIRRRTLAADCERHASPPRAGHYSSFHGPFEAQSLSGVLPFIRADRPELAHPVYEIPNYRMRNARRFSRARAFPDFE